MRAAMKKAMDAPTGKGVGKGRRPQRTIAAMAKCIPPPEEFTEKYLTTQALLE